MKKITFLLSVLGAITLFLGIMSFYTDSSSDSPQTKNNALVNLSQMIQSPPIPFAPDFCGETLDMNDFDLKERLDKELIANSYRHSGTILYLKRANKYFPTMGRILAEEGMPDDLKYLSVAESSLSNAVSPAGAKGFWQFMKGTGKQYGLKIDNEIDERMHLEKSTRAACKYLKQLYKEFGSWSSAAAAYNMGGPNLRKHKKRQKADSYFDLNINKETMRYLFRIVAIKEIMQNPNNYGFYIDDYQKYQPLPDAYDVEVKGAIASWGDFAKKYGISYRKLKIYNPWLVDSKLVNKGKRTYYVKIPK